MSKRDTGRKWMWLFLVVLASLQIYAVRELLAAFALFVLGFGSIAVFALLGRAGRLVSPAQRSARTR
jgi:hypothetical protein